MKMRWLLATTLVGVVLGAAVPLALAAGQSESPAPVPASVTHTGMSWAAMESMHDSPAMQRMHDKMPSNLEKQCDAMHEQMGQVIAGSDSPHAGTTGAAMMGSGATGMMGS